MMMHHRLAGAQSWKRAGGHQRPARTRAELWAGGLGWPSPCQQPPRCQLQGCGRRAARGGCPRQGQGSATGGAVPVEPCLGVTASLPALSGAGSARLRDGHHVLVEAGCPLPVEAKGAAPADGQWACVLHTSGQAPDRHVALRGRRLAARVPARRRQAVRLRASAAGRKGVTHASCQVGSASRLCQGWRLQGQPQQAGGGDLTYSYYCGDCTLSCLPRVRPR